MLEEAEKNLLRLDQGAKLSDVYNVIFRVLHSVKGGEGMLGLTELQEFVHRLESQFQDLKGMQGLTPDQASYFLKGIDQTRSFFDGKKPDLSQVKVPPMPKTTPGEIPKITHATPALVQNSTIPTKRAPRNRELLFVLDDEPDILEILSDTFSRQNWEVRTFTDPGQALISSLKERPDVIISDFKMPELTGLDVLDFVSKKLPSTPVIFLSGFLSKDILMRSIDLGLFAAIEKPFNTAKLLPIIEQAIEKRRLEKTLNDAINFIFYQYSDLQQFLQQKGDPTLTEIMDEQLQKLLESKKKIGRHRILKG